MMKKRRNLSLSFINDVDDDEESFAAEEDFISDWHFDLMQSDSTEINLFGGFKEIWDFSA